MPELVVQDVSCSKRDRILFENLSLRISSGQVIHLRGPNGAGKTSLLRIIAGLSQADTGTVLWNSQPLNAAYFETMVYLGHKSGLTASLSALENLQYWAHLHQVPCSETLLYDLLTRLGLVGLEDLPVKMLSAGQQRRVALARLWLKPGQLWILDEPFTALDTAGIALIEQHITQFVASGGAVILTSHQTLRATPYLQVVELEYNL